MGEEAIFRDQVVWMKVFLNGPNKIPLKEKQKIMEVLVMYGLDPLWEENPRVRQTFAAGKAEGKTEGQLEGLRSSVEMMTSVRFPGLTDLVRQKVASITESEELSTLLKQVTVAANEETARRLLLPQKPS